MQRALDTAAESGAISFKDYGKQRIFLARQDRLDVLSSEALEGLTAGNAEKQSEAMRLKETCSELERGGGKRGGEGMGHEVAVCSCVA